MHTQRPSGMGGTGGLREWEALVVFRSTKPGNFARCQVSVTLYHSDARKRWRAGAIGHALICDHDSDHLQPQSATL